ncbi:MAG: hypothetical protein LBN42_00695 [Oscillospiraceae bacterium]|jgi:hypothetical protein|nr:hypothetical protein [Oscillospiraceae bacterium]
MQVTLADFKQDVDKYVLIAARENVALLNDGKTIITLTRTPKVELPDDCEDDLGGLFGCIKLPSEYDDTNYPYYKDLSHRRLDEKYGNEPPHTGKISGEIPTAEQLENADTIEDLLALVTWNCPPEYDDPNYDPLYEKLREERLQERYGSL